MGRAPTAPEADAQMAVADQIPQVANLEVAHGPGTRYLVQRWSDGTYCDKTGKPREVEVQVSTMPRRFQNMLTRLVRSSPFFSFIAP